MFSLMLLNSLTSFFFFTIFSRVSKVLKTGVEILRLKLVDEMKTYYQLYAINLIIPFLKV